MRELFTVNIMALSVVVIALLVAVVFVGGPVAGLLALAAIPAGGAIGVWIGQAQTLKSLESMVLELQKQL